MPCPPPGDLPNQGIEPALLMSPALAGRFFTASATWEVLIYFFIPDLTFKSSFGFTGRWNRRSRDFPLSPSLQLAQPPLMSTSCSRVARVYNVGPYLDALLSPEVRCLHQVSLLIWSIFQPKNSDSTSNLLVNCFPAIIALCPDGTSPVA